MGREEGGVETALVHIVGACDIGHNTLLCVTKANPPAAHSPSRPRRPRRLCVPLAQQPEVVVGFGTRLNHSQLVTYHRIVVAAVSLVTLCVHTFRTHQQPALNAARQYSMLQA